MASSLVALQARALATAALRDSQVSPAAGSPAAVALPLHRSSFGANGQTLCVGSRSSSRSNSRRASIVASASEEEGNIALEEASGAGGEPFTHGEWNATHSILNFEDVMAHYEPMMFKENAQPSTLLSDIMSTTVKTARPTQAVSDVKAYFDEISGVPVVNDELKVVGVVSKKDLDKSTDPNAQVKDIMSSPAHTAQDGSTVSDAAVLMLKYKVHRIPVVNEEDKLVGIVTRTDVFTNLESN